MAVTLRYLLRREEEKQNIIHRLKMIKNSTGTIRNTGSTKWNESERQFV